MSAFPSLNVKRYLNPKVISDKNIIFHSSYYRTAKGPKLKNIVTVHDFTYELRMKGLLRYFHIFQKRKALKNADGIICISENTKKDMLELYPYLKNKKIKVIYNGFSSSDYYHDSNIVRENFALFVGARTNYKNFDKAIDIVAATKDVSLVIVGGPLNENEKNTLNIKLSNRYELYSHISNKELNTLYNKSICLLYLSEYEGFGIPIIEAMSAGCPVLALNKSSIPEVAGEAGVLFSEYNINDIVSAVHSLRNDQNLRIMQIELGFNNAKRFSWDLCYQETLKFYNDFQ